jgi:hypothetical protein
MNGGPNAQPINIREILCAKRALSIEDRCDGILGPRECCAERIADRFEYVAIVLGDRRLHERIVPAHGILHRRPVAVPTLCAALDIGERERDGTGWAGRGRRLRFHASRHEPAFSCKAVSHHFLAYLCLLLRLPSRRTG